jgi:alpha-D-xyloside xylohydrolase
MNNNEQNLGNIMHGLSDQSVIPPSQVTFNMPCFPQIDKSKDSTLLLVDSVKRWEIKDGEAFFYVDGTYIHEDYTYRYFDYRQVFRPLANHGNLVVRISFPFEDTVRITMQKGFSISESLTNTEMIRGHEEFAHIVEGTEDNQQIHITNHIVDVYVTKNPWKIVICNKGKEIFRQFGKDNHSFMPYEICPFGFYYDNENKKSYACDSLALDPYEHVYGLGENFSKLDRRGRDFTLWNTNALGVNTNRCYKNIPFLHSSKGYGLFINSSNKMHVDCGKKLSKALEMMVGCEVLDYFLFIQPTLEQQMLPYFKLTGRPVVPPKWSFGLWISKISYRSQQEVKNVSERLRKEKIPCDVIHVDTDWFAENWVCDWKFDINRFPNVKQMLSDLHQKGFKLSLWQLPYIERGNISTEVYDEGVSKGYFAANENGDLLFPHGLIDFTNPEAVRWYQEKLLKPLLELGVDVIKVDFGESAPENFQYAGMDGKVMHNLYSLLYNKAVFEETERVHGTENAIIWARSGWAGSQKYPVHWGGDAGTDYGSLANSLAGCLNLSLSGIPFWSSDVGGFWFRPDDDVYIRWVQFGMFCSHARLHGFYTREPWDFGEQALSITRKYVNLRYQLMPYIYNQAIKVRETGVLFHQPMVYAFPRDENCRSIDTQYMFGSELLVAPVLNKEGDVRFYVPDGVWTNLLDDNQISGNQWVRQTYAMDEFPVYARENAIIPMCQVMQYVGELPEDLTFHFYPGADGNNTFTLYEQKIQVRMDCSRKSIGISFSGENKDYQLVIHNVHVVDIKDSNGREVKYVVKGNNVSISLSNGQTKLIINR